MSKQITLKQRYQIDALLKANHKKSFIADQLGFHKSTIGREIRRNKSKRTYNAQRADEYTSERRADSYKRKYLTEPIKRYIKEKISEDWSPEQIVGVCKKDNIPIVSHERIYQYIYQDKLQGGNLFSHLRTTRPKRHKRKSQKSSRYGISNRVFIDHRPEIVDAKERFGDWEADTIVGTYNKGAILTIVERKSMYTVMAKTMGKYADSIRKEMINALAPYKQLVHTITSDNGTEFAQHQSIAKKLDADFYFAHPYSSWERGLNENTNKLIRQYIPKKKSFDLYEQPYIYEIAFKLNTRPRKSLGFKSPNQVFLTNFENQVAFIT